MNVASRILEPAVARAGRRSPRRALQLFASVLVALSLSLGLAGSASASVATSWGFACNSSYNYVHQNWPNISTDSATNSTVYTRSFLYRWNGAQWVNVVTSPWYVGVSNVTGRKALGYFGGLPYYFALPASPSLVLSNTGYAFTALSDGYYRTLEQFWASGVYWAAWSHVQGSSASYCAA